MRKLPFLIMMTLIAVWFAFSAQAKPVDTVSPKERCKVCGMMVAKYKPWITQLQSSDGNTLMFDGVKDMMVLYFEPEKYGGAIKISNIYVKDYYTLEWIDGRKALYVTGSDVLGPMGHEFIPFATQAAADNFKKDHHGKQIMTFDAITKELVQSMRSGM